MTRGESESVFHQISNGGITEADRGITFFPQNCLVTPRRIRSILTSRVFNILVQVGEQVDSWLCEEDQHEGRQLCVDGEHRSGAERHEAVWCARRRAVPTGRSV